MGFPVPRAGVKVITKGESTVAAPGHGEHVGK
jgi:hypothetical protein